MVKYISNFNKIACILDRIPRRFLCEQAIDTLQVAIYSGPMKQNVSALLKKNLGRDVFSKIKKVADVALTYSKTTYSQFGEDQFLQDYFKNKARGFFVDVGAYHPRQFSNTYLLYKKGWRGVNIDATPGSMSLFHLLRPADRNVECAVSDSKDVVRLSVWGTDSENTVHQEHSGAVESHKGAPVQVVELTPKTLTEILDADPNTPKNFDVLSVDVEGWDMNVLQSLDWSRYSPQIVLVELYATTLDVVLKSELYLFMTKNGYQLTAWYNPTLIFKRK